MVMFDPATGMMLEGIGHYTAQPAGDRKIVCIAENPYPCDFDRGLITAMAARFERGARVIHDDTAPCRKKGADSCKFLISW